MERREDSEATNGQPEVREALEVLGGDIFH
jgi:hypothetical protein